MKLPARKIWNKMTHMSWKELRTRLGQEFGKRIEYAIYRAGLQRTPPIDPETRDYASRFFFSKEEIGPRVDLLRRYLPEAISATVHEADEILKHRFRLLGYVDLDYGAEIDWRLDAVHSKHAPLKPWYKIRFLDFEEVGDHKVTWELNRHQHLIVLAKASAFTDEKTYVDEIERQFYSWQKANPYPVGINWGSSLEVAFRSLSWIWVRQLLDASISERLDRDLVRALARNGDYIDRYLSTYFSPNTHLLGEALALFFIGVLCPEIAAAKKWQATGLEVLTREIRRQVRPDGLYFEQSLYYHVYALDMFLYARVLAEANGLRLPPDYDDTLHRMLNLLEVACRNGPAQGFGDDDGGRLFNPRRNRAEHMADPLAIGASLFKNIDFPSAVPTEESIWLFGEEALTYWEGRRRKPELNSCAFEDGGLYVISSDGARSSQMLVDAGPHGIGHGGHGHADALSLRLSIDGSPWLIDPGAYIYISPANERNEFRGTSAHNTLRIDQADQAVPETPFSWTSLPDVKTDQWQAGELFTFFSGSHNGYRRLKDPVSHHRSIFHLHGEYSVVRDTLFGAAQHELEIFWHFTSGVELTAHESSLNAELDSHRLAILSASSTPWDCHREEGLVSPAYGTSYSAPVGIFRTRRELPTEHASLLVYQPASEHPGDFRMSAFDANAMSYLYRHRGLEDRLFFGLKDGSWTCDTLLCDANFLFLRREGREITMLVFCGGSFLEISGQRIFSSPGKVARLEWSLAAGASASDPQSLKFFHGQLIRAGTPVR